VSSTDHEEPLYAYSHILALGIWSLLASCIWTPKVLRGQIVLIEMKVTGRTLCWNFLTVQSQFVAAVHN
jgi:hypothetical protein